MKNFILILVTFSLIGLETPVIAKTKKQVAPNLIVQRATARIIRYRKQYRKRVASRNKTKTTLRYRNKRKKAWALGIEGAAIGRGNNVNPDMLGLSLVYGIRGTALINLTDNFYLKPSLGYFTDRDSSESSRGTSIQLTTNQTRIELSANVQYIPKPWASTHFIMGISNRLEAIQVVTNFQGNTSNDNPWSLRYRIGPMVGMGINLTKQFQINPELEATIPLNSAFKIFPSFSLGMRYLFF